MSQLPEWMLKVQNQLFNKLTAPSATDKSVQKLYRSLGETYADLRRLIAALSREYKNNGIQNCQQD